MLFVSDAVSSLSSGTTTQLSLTSHFLIKIFSRKCINSLLNCSVSNLSGNLPTEIKKEILKKAASYKQGKIEESPDKDFVYPDTSGGVF